MLDDENEQYYLTIKSNYISILDSDGNVLGSIESNDSVKNDEQSENIEYGILSTGKWSSSSFMSSRSNYISWDEQLTVTTGISVITTLLNSAVFAWIGIAAAVTYTVAANIYNNKAHNILISRYMATWIGCPILIKEYFQYHSPTMSRHYGTSYPSPRWIGDKWNYSNPAACRTASY